ncbi:fibronectin type III domain-containing protein [Pontibacter sp. G13]|uniref:fibronectin type III domain-containing protein n=1 Tax=Pontibacter sp. G13 TaxID=3074898 RepID=UPI00288C26B7|nr:fibronectin type III domain-containing protein [Pontibacter sp. G13]WNJ17868.1 fibronectin type III domain-containing protein [Pontibacter sp. G13]
MNFSKRLICLSGLLLSASLVGQLLGQTTTSNLLGNPGAESGLTDWTIEQGVVEALASNQCGTVPAQDGGFLFVVGGACSHSALGIAYQQVDVSTYATEIDAADVTVHFEGYLRDWNGKDLPEIYLRYLDANAQEIGTSPTLSHQNATWTLKNASELVPANTRSIRFYLKGTRNSGSDNDSYIDALSMTLTIVNSPSPPAAGLNTNLLINGGAEDQLTDWTVDQGVVEALLSSECGTVPAFAGSRLFVVGGACSHSALGLAHQDVDVSAFSQQIDNDELSAVFGGQQRDWDGTDIPEIYLTFLDGSSLPLETTASITGQQASWVLDSLAVNVPSGTRTIQFFIKGTRNAGNDNDSYMDELFVKLTDQSGNGGGGNDPLDVSLLLNGGAEDQLTHWTLDQGVVEALLSSECGTVPAYAGDRFFVVGGACSHSALGLAHQDVDISPYATRIDNNELYAYFGGRLRDWSGSDVPEVYLEFLNGSNQVISTGASISSQSATWTEVSLSEAIPSGTRTIRYFIQGTRNDGTDNDSYMDELFLRVTNEFIDGGTGNAQFVVQPYLQHATPASIKVMWETAAAGTSIVQWGTTASLGNTATGTSATGNGNSRIHTVQLTGLSANTRYFYKAQTGSDESAIKEFKTPPTKTSEQSFNLVALSDMQSNNVRFETVITSGIIKYVNDSLNGDLPMDLGMVLIPGDLVTNGGTYSQWANDFFAPSHQLLAQVPLYPVIGNHDDYGSGTANYLKYFDLPTNGTSGYLEQWYYYDYSNLRVIGLNSTDPVSATQLAWLDQVLLDAGIDPTIDFVFAQLHHPHKSELWAQGESNFSTDVVGKLEQFSSNYGKPSIHFFGHTHGYSRGQSRDHHHVMVNVGGGGGALDNWGEGNWIQNDYEEFSVSQDEFGFVFVKVEAGPTPKFELKKLGMGQENNMTPIALRDHMVVKRFNNAPQTPTAISPIGTSNDATLKASAFSDSDNDGFGAAHWQVSTNSSFSNIVFDQWKQHENWFFNQDSQAGDDLTDIEATGLNAGTTYYWRVRYRDQALEWSDWSVPASFSLTQSSRLAGTSNGIEAGDLAVYPNPSNGVIYLETIEAAQNAQEVVVMDLTGRAYLTVSFTQTSTLQKINLENLPAGIYVLRLTFESGEIENVKVIRN